MPVTYATRSADLTKNLGFRLSLDDYAKLLRFAEELALSPAEAMRLIVRHAVRVEQRVIFRGAVLADSGVGDID